MPDIGPPMTWKLQLDNQITRGAEEAKASINGVEQAGNKATGSMSVLNGATKKNAEGIRALGSISMIAGTSILSTGIAAQNAGGDMERFAPILIGIGTGMTAVGSMSMIAGPLIKAAGYAHTAIQPAIMGTTAALWGEYAALSAIEKSTIIGAVISGVVLLGSAMATMSQNTNTANQSFKTQADKLKAAGDAAKTYETALKDLSDLQTKLAGIPGDIRETKRQIQLNALDITKAEREYNATDSQMRTTPEQQEEWQRRGIELNALRDRGEKLKQTLIQQEAEALALPGEVSQASQKAGMAGLQKTALANAPISKEPVLWGLVPEGAKYTNPGTTESMGSFSKQGSGGPNMPQVAVYIENVNVNDKATWDAIIKDTTNKAADQWKTKLNQHGVSVVGRLA